MSKKSNIEIIPQVMECPIHKRSMKSTLRVLTTEDGIKYYRNIFKCPICEKYYVHCKNKENSGKKYTNYDQTPIYFTSQPIYSGGRDVSNDSPLQSTATVKKVDLVKKIDNTINKKSKKNKKERKKIVKKKDKKGDTIQIYRFSNKNKIEFLNNKLKRIKQEYPKLVGQNININDFIKKFFPSKLDIKCNIRNMSYNYKNKDSSQALCRRAEISREDFEFTENILPKNSIVVFAGQLKKGEFVIDDVKIVENQIAKIDDTIKIVKFSYDGPNKNNCLYDILDAPAKNSQHISSEIKLWSEYLDWKRQLSELRIKGLKYVSFKLDYDKNEISFLSVVDGIDSFNSFKKHLRKNEVSIFSNEYSKNKHVFDLNKDDTRKDNIDSGIVLNFKTYKSLGDISNIDIDDWSQWISFSKNYSDDIYDLNNEINEILNLYNEPLCYQIVFELSDFDIEFLERQIKNYGDISYDDENRIAKNYYSNGFIATTFIGDFVLNNRLKTAIDNLINGKSASEGLENWLFDIKKARNPKEIIDITEWQNKNINENQKDAVRKILSTPDVCLVQGPPGTGKTTVIAEAIYQLVIRNKRVLVSSQANLAVDNALERLISNPKVRAIRLGNAKKIDSYVSNISENNVLNSFYNTIGNYINEHYLNSWADIDIQKEENLKQIESFKNINNELSKVNNELNAINSKLDRLNKAKASISELIENDKTQLDNLLSSLKTNHINEFKLSKNILSSIYNSIEHFIQEMDNNGINLSNVNIVENTSIDMANNILFITISNLIKLKQMKTKLNNSNENIQDSDYIEELRLKEKILQSKLLELDSIEMLIEWKNVKKQLEAAYNKNNYLSENELSLFKNINNQNNKEEILNVLNKNDGLINHCFLTLENAISQSLNELDNNIDSLNYFNIDGSTLFELTQEKNNYTERKNDLENQKAHILMKFNCNENNIEAAVSNKNYELELSENKKINRIDWEDVFEDFNNWVNDLSNYDQENEIFLKDFINGCNVVGVSCTENSRTLEENGFDNFDVVIIDEVSKATPPELLIPMLKGKKIVLVGDHRQLPPLFNEHEKTYKEVIESQENDNDFLTLDNFYKYKDMVTSSLFEMYFENSDNSIKETLRYQYRMHKDIMDIINRFYDGYLIDGNKDKYDGTIKEHNLAIPSINGTKMIEAKKHAYWFDSSEINNVFIEEQRREGSTSAQNLIEAVLIVELLKKIDKKYTNSSKLQKTSIGVISFYYDQVLLIKNMLRDEKFSSIDVEVNTVDRFQGKEKEIIFVSLVRNVKNHHHGTNSHIAAFERINVAFSRAQNLLVIVGAKDMYVDQPVVLTDMNNGEEKTTMAYKDIIEELMMKGAYFSANEVISSSFGDEIINEINKAGVK